MDEHSKFEKLMDLIHQVVSKMESIHAPTYDFGTGVPLYRSEIHTIQAIGHNKGINITELAEHLEITKGAVSQMINKLVRKGLVVKTRIGADARETVLGLTDLGLIGFRAHEQFHLDMYKLVREYFGDQFEPKLDMFYIVMNDLNKILTISEHRTEQA